MESREKRGRKPTSSLCNEGVTLIPVLTKLVGLCLLNRRVQSALFKHLHIYTSNTHLHMLSKSTNTPAGIGMSSDPEVRWQYLCSASSWWHLFSLYSKIGSSMSMYVNVHISIHAEAPRARRGFSSPKQDEDLFHREKTRINVTSNQSPEWGPRSGDRVAVSHVKRSWLCHYYNS